MIWTKQILTVFLMAVFSFPLVSPVLLQVKQMYVQWQMQESLEKQELVHVRIKTSDIEWIKSKKECVINGDMFDVKHIQIINDETVLTGLYDKKEKEIRKDMEDQTKNQQQSGKTLQLVKLYSVLQNNFASVEITDRAFLLQKKLAIVSLSVYKIPFLGINTPPPKYS